MKRVPLLVLERLPLTEQIEQPQEIGLLIPAGDRGEVARGQCREADSVAAQEVRVYHQLASRFT